MCSQLHFAQYCIIVGIYVTVELELLCAPGLGCATDDNWLAGIILMHRRALVQSTQIVILNLIQHLKFLCALKSETAAFREHKWGVSAGKGVWCD